MADYTITVTELSPVITISQPAYTIEAGGNIVGAVTAVNGDVGAVTVKSVRARGTAVGAVSALKVVAQVSGGFSVADPSDLAHYGAVSGVAFTAAIDGGAFTLVTSGEMEDSSWDWTAASPIFLGAGGALTQTYPVGSVFCQEVGIPLSSTKMLVRPLIPLKLA